MDRPLVLSLDGSTGVCSVALLSAAPQTRAGTGPLSWEVVDSRAEGDGRAQAKVLLRLAHEMLEEQGMGPEALSAVVVGTGPGTFTGVRITVATARALALSLRIPVLGVSTLAGLAASAAEERPDAEVIVPVIDARRKQVFYALYQRTSAHAGGAARWTRVGPYSVCDRDTLAETIAERVAEAEGTSSGGSPLTVVAIESELAPTRLLAGQDCLALDMQAEWLVVGQSSLVEPGDHPEGDRLDGFLVAVDSWGGADQAASGGRVSAGEAGAIGTPESVKPVYVRAPDADIHIKKMRDPWASQADRP